MLTSDNKFRATKAKADDSPCSWLSRLFSFSINSLDGGDTMQDIERLKHLLEHWAEHNSEHAETYQEWSRKAGVIGRAELAGILKEIAEETLKMDALFKKAAGLCD